jgi:hypothetical protein
MIMKSGGLGRGDGDLEGGVLGGVFEDVVASSIWAKVNECVPIFSAGMRPLATIFSRVGMDTRSRRALGRRSPMSFPALSPVPGATIRARSPAKPGGIRRFRYEANGQECPDWFKIPQDLDSASAKWQMFLLGPGATIHV